jgi:sterol desaturase/sphingolipid hydroxylase (fatty acid hydroxylase superfamily)
MPDLEKRISAIEARNRKVEKDKLWETSYTRRILLILFTYVAISLYLNAIEVSSPWLNAIVPSIGFWLSTLTLPLFRTLWEKYIHNK